MGLLVLGACACAEVETQYYGTGGASELRVCMNNQGGQAADQHLWAGEVHPCTIPGHQPLVVGEDLVYHLRPHESRTEYVPVYCGNSQAAAPADGMLYGPPRLDQRLRAIIVDASFRNPGDIQSLIWRETDQRRLPEAGPPVSGDYHSTGRPPVGTTAVKGLVSRANVLRGDENMLGGERSEADRRAANSRSLTYVMLFFMIPFPIAIVMLATCSATRRGAIRGGHHR